MSETKTAQSSGDSESHAKKAWHKDHSRKYRANVGEKFQQLSGVLSGISRAGDGSMKYKSDILETALKTIRELNEDVSTLEVEVALSSRKYLMEWIDKSVAKARKPSAALAPLIEILCRKRGWKYVEVWEAKDASAEPKEIALTDWVIRVKDSSEKDLEAFNRRSSAIIFSPGVGLVGRVWSMMRSELMSDVSDPALYMRANLAMCKGISSTVAVPLVVLGQTAAVILFYDTDTRYDLESLRLAESIASSIGTVWGARVRKGDAAAAASGQVIAADAR